MFFTYYSLTVSGQPSMFLKTYTDTPGYTVYNVLSQSIDTLSQNSFITAGYSLRWANNASDSLCVDGFLHKTEISGLTKWYINYHLHGFELSFYDVKVLKNKDILIGGQTNVSFTNNPSVKNGILLRTDSNGYVKWCKFFPRQKICRLLQMKNGNIAVLASDSGGFWGKRLKLALLDHNTNPIWCKKFMSADSSQFDGVDLIEGKDKRLLIIGGYPDRFLILTDSSGNVIQDLSISTPTNVIYKQFYSGVNNYDKGFYVVGLGQDTLGNATGSVLKIDNSLNILWYKLLYATVGGACEFWDIDVLGPNNFIILNEPENYGAAPFGAKRSGFTFIDSNGVARKNILFSPNNLDIIPDDFIMLRNGYALFTTAWTKYPFFGITDTISNGFCSSTTFTFVDASINEPFFSNRFAAINATFNYSIVSLYLYAPFATKIEYHCSTGPTGPLDPINPPTNLIDVETNDNFRIFPNPANEVLFLTCPSTEKCIGLINAKVELIDFLGQTVLLKNNSTNVPYIRLEIKDLPNGLYFLNVESSNSKIFSKKIIISH